MRRKIFIIILIVITLAAAMWYSYGFFRLAIIRATINLPLPGWILSLLWGVVTWMGWKKNGWAAAGRI